MNICRDEPSLKCLGMQRKSCNAQQCANSVHIKFDTLGANEMNVTRNVDMFPQYRINNMTEKAYMCSNF